MWLMLQQEQPDDYVIGTGVSHSVRDLVEAAFADRRPGLRGLRPDRPGSGHGPPRSRRWSPTPSKAREVLGWEPRVSFEELIEMMVEADLERLRAG